MKSFMSDSKIAVFFSPHMKGDVKVEYCVHQQLLVLRYHTKNGVVSCGYDVTKPREMRNMMLDAIALAAKPVEERE